jgi:ankyrin repeat protein
MSTDFNFVTRDAIRFHNLTALRWALEQGADVNALVETSGMPLLCYAIHSAVVPEQRGKFNPKGSTEAVEILLAAGADVNIRGVRPNESSALYYTTYISASDVGLRCARLLLQADADVNCVNAFGSTPLHLAITSDNEPLARLFLDTGANPSIVNKFGSTPMDIAFQRGSFKMTLMLLRAGAALKIFPYSQINSRTARVHDQTAHIVNMGGFAACVSRHERRCLSVLSRCTGRLPVEVQRQVLSFWSPAGGWHWPVPRPSGRG